MCHVRLALSINGVRNKLIANTIVRHINSVGIDAKIFWENVVNATQGAMPAAVILITL